LVRAFATWTRLAVNPIDHTMNGREATFLSKGVAIRERSPKPNRMIVIRKNHGKRKNEYDMAPSGEKCCS
jgi:hypothetical protein